MKGPRAKPLQCRPMPGSASLEKLPDRSCGQTRDAPFYSKFFADPCATFKFTSLIESVFCSETSG